MIPEIILLSLISIFILKIRGKKLNTITANLEIKGYQLLLIAVVIEIAAEFIYKNFSTDSLSETLSLHWLIYFAILAVTLINFNKTFMKLLFIGTLLNFIAIVANDFRMPVLVTEIIPNAEAKRIYLQTGQDLVHSLLTDKTRFKILCDIINIPPPYPFPKTLSIGDVFLLLGVFVAWQEPKNTKNPIEPPANTDSV